MALKKNRVAPGTKAAGIDLGKSSIQAGLGMNDSISTGKEVAERKPTTSPIDSPALNRGTSLLGRLSSRSRVLRLPVSKSDVTLTLENIDPRETWVNPKINPRHQKLLKEDDPSISQLRSSIVRESQRDPVLLRRNPGPNGETFEVIYGSCRRFVALLETESRSEVFPLLAEVGNIPDDVDAMRLARSENEDREDLSPWEKAIDILRLSTSLFRDKSLEDIAQAIGESRRTVVNYKALARLPEEVLGLLRHPRQLTLADGLRLVKVIEEGNAPGRLKNLISSQEVFDSVPKLIAALRIELIETGSQKIKVTAKAPRKIISNDGTVFAVVKALRDKPGQYKIDLPNMDETKLADLVSMLEKIKG